MAPTFSSGEMVLADVSVTFKDRGPAEGDIVVAQHPTTPGLLLVKRVKFIDEHGRYYLSSDNPSAENVQDSATFGPVSREGLLGKVVATFG